MSLDAPDATGRYTGSRPKQRPLVERFEWHCSIVLIATRHRFVPAWLLNRAGQPR